MPISDRALKASDEAFKNGAEELSELFTAQENHTKLQTDAIRAKADEFKALINILYLQGSLTAQILGATQPQAQYISYDKKFGEYSLSLGINPYKEIKEIRANYLSDVLWPSANQVYDHQFGKKNMILQKTPASHPLYKQGSSSSAAPSSTALAPLTGAKALPKGSLQRLPKALSETLPKILPKESSKELPKELSSQKSTSGGFRWPWQKNNQKKNDQPIKNAPQKTDRLNGTPAQDNLSQSKVLKENATVKAKVNEKIKTNGPSFFQKIFKKNKETSKQNPNAPVKKQEETIRKKKKKSFDMYGKKIKKILY